MLTRRGASTAGRLRMRLVLEKPARAADGAGGAALDWLPSGSLPAEVTPLKAEERPSGDGLADMILHRIVIRHRGDVVPGDRFRHGSRTFLILAMHDPDEDGRFLACLAEEAR